MSSTSSYTRATQAKRQVAKVILCITIVMGMPFAYARSRINGRSCGIFFSDIKPNARIIERNAFTTDRNMEEYIAFAGPEFARIVRRLGPKQRWIDVGGGGAQAMFDLYREYRDSGKIALLPHMTDITRTLKPYDWEYQEKTEFRSFAKFQLLSGKYIQEYKSDKIQKGDLTTDIQAAMTWSPDVDAVLTKIGEITKPGGTVIFTIINKKLIIRDSNGKRVPTANWIRQAKGLKLLRVEDIEAERRSFTRFILKRTSGPVIVPHLKLIKFYLDNNIFSRAPYRSYLISRPSLR